MTFAYAIPIPINFPDDGTSVLHHNNIITVQSYNIMLSHCLIPLSLRLI